jgi:hypothetical protein
MGSDEPTLAATLMPRCGVGMGRDRLTSGSAFVRHVTCRGAFGVYVRESVITYPRVGGLIK